MINIMYKEERSGGIHMNKYAIENLFGIQGFHIAWYGVIIAVGMVISAYLASYRAKKKGYNSDLIYDLAIIALPISIVCARIYYVAFEWENYADNLIKIFATREGGLAVYGGVLGGIACGIVFCKVKKFPFFELADIAVPSIILGQIIGRWGNFVNQEAFGNLVTNPKLQFFPYAVYIDSLAEWHQATFFYESAWNCILLIVMLVILKKVKKPGYSIAIYFIGYGIGRYMIEGLRTDSLYILPGIRVSQMLSLVLIMLGVIIITFIKKDNRPRMAYEGPYLLGYEKENNKQKEEKDAHKAS